jgi:rhamnosyltransferase
MQETDVCAILVTYHPDEELPARLGSIRRQVGAAVIVDNGSTDAELIMLRKIAADSAVTLELNFENLGVARALNIGIQRAVTLGYSAVLLLDQDSQVDCDMVKTLLAIHESFPTRERLAIIGSGFRDVHKPSPDPCIGDAFTEQWQDAECVITSGTLLPLAAFSVIGPFRDEFFIDFVDLDYCNRARAHGYRVIKSRRLLMSHSIGAPTLHRMLWTRKWTTNYSADRRYYSVRNRTVILREYGDYRMGGWALKSLFSCLKISKRIILYERAKAGKLVAVAAGWWDGVHGNLGPRDWRRQRSRRAFNEIDVNRPRY